MSAGHRKVLRAFGDRLFEDPKAHGADIPRPVKHPENLATPELLEWDLRPLKEPDNGQRRFTFVTHYVPHDGGLYETYVELQDLQKRALTYYKLDVSKSLPTYRFLMNALLEIPQGVNDVETLLTPPIRNFL